MPTQWIVHAVDPGSLQIKNVETCFGIITYQRTDIISAHLDDFYLQGKTYNECSSNIIDTVTLFTKLGFLVHPEKSTFSPAQEIVTTRIHIKLSHYDSKTDTGQSISYKVGLRYSEMFKAASTSCVKAAGLNLEQIMKSAGWSNSSTFAKFYQKPVVTNNFYSTILDTTNNEV